MSKHTQGPWKADGYSIRQSSTGTRHVAEIAYTGPHHTPPEEYPKSCRLQDEANARLIAAAPDLLEVCERLANLDMTGTDDSLVRFIVLAHQNSAKSAIAKATNETP